jgi:O-antigen/teichoic acid export membrane protein
MATGIAWMSLMRIGVKTLGLLSTVVLARLLVPADFGLVAMAMSVIGALELLRAFSFDVALIQRQDADRSYYDTAWTLNIVFGVVLAVLVLLAAFPAADFYNEPRLSGVMFALALVALISGFENVGVVAFRKDLTFHKEFLLRVSQKACGLAITLPFALILRSYWALVIGMVSSSAASVLLSYYAHPFRPRISFAARVHLLSFSKWTLVNEMLWFIRDRSPDYLIGRIAGPTALGTFTISFEISNLPTTELISPVNRAVLPGYAKMADNLEALRQGFLNVIGLVAALALPAGFGLAAISEPLVDVVLGPKWTAAVPLVSVLAIFGGLNALTTNFAALHYAMGRPSTLTIVGAIQIAVLLPLVVWSGNRYGPIGIAWVFVAHVALVCIPLQYGIGMSRLHLRFGRLAALFWRPIIATAFMYAVVSSIAAGSLDSSLPTLAVVIVLGAGSYAGVIAVLWIVAGRPAGPERTFADRFLLPTWNRIAANRQGG